MFKSRVKAAPDFVVYTGPPGSGKTAKLIGHFNDARREHREQRVLFIVPDITVREHYRDIIARQPLGDEKSIRAFSDIGLRTLGSIIRSLGGAATVNQTHLRLFIDSLIEQEILDVEEYPILKTPGGRAALARAVMAVRVNGQTGSDVNNLGMDIVKTNSPLPRTMLHWERQIDNENKHDEHAVLLKAAINAESESDKWDIVLIDGFTEIRPMQWEVIKSLLTSIGHAYAAIDPGQYPSEDLLNNFLAIGFKEEKLSGHNRWDGCQDLAWLADVNEWEINSDAPAACPENISADKLKIIMAANPAIEAASLAREVARCVMDGYKYSDITIIAPHLRSFRNTLESRFKRAGIRIRFFIDTPLIETGAGSFLHSMLSLLSGDWSDETVCGLLSHPMSGVDKSQSGAAIAKTTNEERLNSIEAWLEWSENYESANLILIKLSELRECETVEPMGFVDEVIGIADQTICKGWRELSDEILAEEGWVWDKIRNVMRDSARAVKEMIGNCAPSEIAKNIRIDLENAAGRPLDRRSDAVNAVTPLNARTWSVKVAMVAGLAREYFPHYQTPNPFLPDKIRTALNLPSYDDLKAREKALFRVMATRACDRLVLSWPCSDSSGSLMLMSGPLQKMIEWTCGFENIQKVEHDPPNNSDDAVFVTDLAVLALEKCPDDENLIHKIAGRVEHPLEGAVRADHYESARLAEASLLVDAACGTDERPISPTKMNDLAQCPYRFFASRLLGLSDADRDLIERGIDPMLWGSIAHQALLDWFGNGKKGDFEKFVRNAAAKNPRVIPGSENEAKIGQIIDTLKRFEVFEKKYLRPLGYEQIESELKFLATRKDKDQTVRDPVRYEVNKDITLTISGIIDRIDTKGRKSALVADYKRSRNYKDEARLKEFRDFQLAFYIILAESGLGLDVDMACFLPLRKILTKGAGRIIYEEDVAPLLDSSMFKADEELTASQYLENVKTKIANLIERISSGDITPKPADNDLCGDRCSYRDLCRFRFTGDEGFEPGGDE